MWDGNVHLPRIVFLLYYCYLLKVTCHISSHFHFLFVFLSVRMRLCTLYSWFCLRWHYSRNPSTARPLLMKEPKITFEWCVKLVLSFSPWSTSSQSFINYSCKCKIFKFFLKLNISKKCYKSVFFFRMSQIVFFEYLLFNITFCDENF